ncbi:MAG: TonB-dependent receptor, partial [Pseudomonadota bacterium]
MLRGLCVRCRQPGRGRGCEFRPVRLEAVARFVGGALAGLGLGAGVTALSSRPGDLGNTFTTDALATVDAQVAYRRGPVEVGLGIDNLFDT